MTGRIRILHVDDEPEFAELVAAYLERADDRCEVETATGPRDGLATLADAPFDCVVSDYDMPGMDGIAFLERVRETHPELPFILFTGKGSEEVASDAISSGVTDYLQKETGTDQYTVLANRIVNAVEAHEAEADLARRSRQNGAVADLSREAIEGIDPQSLAERAVDRGLPGRTSRHETGLPRERPVRRPLARRPLHSSFFTRLTTVRSRPPAVNSSGAIPSCWSSPNWSMFSQVSTARPSSS
jgi:CheY-like chemotaxis protein